MILCAECHRPVDQRPDRRWMHRIPRPADPTSRVIDPIASAEYGHEIGVWLMRTSGHKAQPAIGEHADMFRERRSRRRAERETVIPDDITSITVRGCSCVDGCARCGGTGRLDG